MTIYEKIKTLSMGGMADFLTEYAFGCEECEEGKRKSNFKGCDKNCHKHCLEWLAKEAAE